jgi:hypothetical protein
VFLVLDEKTGLHNRPFKTTRKIFYNTLKTFKAKLLRHLNFTKPYTTEEFVESYVGRKKKNYANAANSLELKPLTIQDTYIQGFIKDEKTDFTSKPNKCSRLISPCSARFNLVIGKYLKALEKPLFSAINSVYQDTTVLKGLNAKDRGEILRRKWLKFQRPVAVLLDAARFDQHISRTCKNWEQDIQEARTGPGLRRYNKMRAMTKMFLRTDEGYIKVSMRNGRCSGAMDTASGNCLTMCAMTWAYMEEIGISKYSYANDGDDGVIIVEYSDLELIRSTYFTFFKKLGFKMKWEGDTEIFEHITFCQCRPVFTGDYWVMQRDPIVVMDKDTMTVKNVRSKKHFDELRNAIGWSGLAVSGNIPIVNELYKRMATGKHTKNKPCESGLDYWGVGMEPKFCTPTDECRISFYRAFAISPETQITVENEIRTAVWSETNTTPILARIFTKLNTNIEYLTQT